MPRPWVKCHPSAVFACALLNSQPMGFYAPAQIVRDAREHGVVIGAVDVNASDWDCTLEPVTASTGGLALRLGLRLVGGLPEAEARAIVAARQARNGAPFGSVEDLAWRAGAGRKALEALATADAFASTGSARRRATWDARGVASGPGDLPLFAIARGTAEAAMAEQAPLLPEPAANLAAQSAGEMVVGDYQATGLTLGQHPLALLRPRLDQLGYADTRRLETVRPGSWIRLPGLVLMRQQPGSAKGIVFLTVEDEHGVGNLVIYPDVAARDRAALVAGRLLLAEGRVEREVEHAEVPIIHLIVRKLADCSDLLDSLTQGEDAAGRNRQGMALALRIPPGLSAVWGMLMRSSGPSRAPVDHSQAKLPASRDFR
jgi:error-prone DNA polymerase